MHGSSLGGHNHSSNWLTVLLHGNDTHLLFISQLQSFLPWAAVPKLKLSSCHEEEHCFARASCSNFLASLLSTEQEWGVSPLSSSSLGCHKADIKTFPTSRKWCILESNHFLLEATISFYVETQLLLFSRGKNINTHTQSTVENRGT